MSNSKHVTTSALPTSSNAYGWDSLDREEIAVAHEYDKMIENHWDGDEDDLLGDKEYGPDNEDSAAMIISKETINAMATYGGHRFVAATSATSTSPRFSVIPEDGEDGIGAIRDRARKESCTGEPVQYVKSSRLTP
jgi:hypothetical protein